MAGTMAKDIAFEMAVSSVRFGAGVTREVGMDLADLGARRALVITDPTLAAMRPVAIVMESLRDSGVPATLYDRVRVEPSDESFLDAIAFARDGGYDAFVAVGGGSTIDTAKAVNLYTTYPPADFLDYVNPPIGKGLPVPGPLKTLIAIPTTAGTGSETTGVSIFDYRPLHAKDRHRQPPAQADTRIPRSGEHAHDAAGSGRLDRPRHPEPRHRVVYRDAVHRPAASGPAVPAACVSGIESHQRRLVDGGAAYGVAVPRPRGRRSVRR